MRRIKLVLSYDGTEYNGWQIQPGLPTIQGILEAAFLDIEKKPVHVAGSGRTDAGVHAMAQVAAVTLCNPIPTSNLKKALNRLLPSDIRLQVASDRTGMLGGIVRDLRIRRRDVHFWMQRPIEQRDHFIVPLRPAGWAVGSGSTLVGHNTYFRRL